jgi:hypothetical protein
MIRFNENGLYSAAIQIATGLELVSKGLPVTNVQRIVDAPQYQQAQITAMMVKDLREKTDEPMLMCKKALTMANGDIVKAEELLRTNSVGRMGMTDLNRNF